MNLAPPSRAPFLLLAHHRSGSNFLNDVLQAHPAIECINEPLSMHTGFFRECDLEHWAAADFDPEQLHPALAGHPELRDFLGEFRRYLLQSNELRVIGLKETVLFGKLTWLKAFAPPLKIVFLKRDPREIVSSVLRSRLMVLWRYGELVPPSFARMFPHYRSRVAAGDPAARAAETVAMSIVVRYELAQRTLGLFDHVVLHLDEFRHEPVQCLDTVSAFLGVTTHPRQLAFLRARQEISRGGAFSSFRAREEVENRWRRDLNEAQLQAIDDVLQAVSWAGHRERAA